MLPEGECIQTSSREIRECTNYDPRNYNAGNSQFARDKYCNYNNKPNFTLNEPSPATHCYYVEILLNICISLLIFLSLTIR